MLYKLETPRAAALAVFLVAMTPGLDALAVPFDVTDEAAMTAAIERIVAEHPGGDYGAASQFTQVFEEYLKAPEVTRQRIYLETMATIYKAVDQKIIIDENANGLLPLLNIPAINK